MEGTLFLPINALTLAASGLSSRTRSVAQGSRGMESSESPRKGTSGGVGAMWSGICMAPCVDNEKRRSSKCGMGDRSRGGQGDISSFGNDEYGIRIPGSEPGLSRDSRRSLLNQLFYLTWFKI